MNYRFLKSVCAAALMASGGHAFAQVQGEASVQVSLAVDVLKSITLELGGEAALTETQTISENLGDPNPRSYEVRSGFTTGCLSLQGVSNIAVRVTGINNAPAGNLEPFLRGDGAASDVYLSYYPVLAIAPPGTDFAPIFNASRSSSTGLFWIYNNYDPVFGGVGGAGNRNGASSDLFNAPAALGSAPCTASEPNIAFGAMVGIDQPVSSFADGSNKTYGNINQLLDAETELSEGTVNFTDTVTVLITPRLS
jgi:hypothetical protein